MIHVAVHLADGHTEITVDGHEGHTEQGRVCAAVSAVIHAAALGLQEISLRHPHLVTFDLQENP